MAEKAKNYTRILSRNREHTLYLIIIKKNNISVIDYRFKFISTL